jgi:hypothetical protein
MVYTPLHTHRERERESLWKEENVDFEYWAHLVGAEPILPTCSRRNWPP